MSHWIKLYTEILNDIKMARMSDRLWRRCIELFLLAGEVEQDGHLPSTEDIAWYLRMDVEELAADLAELAQRGIIAPTETGWLVVHFAERQAPSKEALKMRKWRERKRQDGDNDGEVTRDVTSDVTRDVTSDVTRFRPDTDTDTEYITTTTTTAPPAENADVVEDALAWKEARRELENCIGLLSPAIAEEARDYWRRFQARDVVDWYARAIREAEAHGKRNWAYIRAIMDRALADGKPPGAPHEARASPRSNGRGKLARGDPGLSDNGGNRPDDYIRELGLDESVVVSD